MMKLKKTTALLLAFITTLSLATAAACNSGQSSTGESSSASVENSLESSPESSLEETESSEQEDSSEDTAPDFEPVWGEWKEKTAPTCTDEGEKVRYALNDPTFGETAPIAARGHDYSGADGTCIRCEQAAVIPPLNADQQFTAVDVCTHTDTEIYEEGICDCAYKGRGEEYSRLELTEGCYTVETVTTSEVTNALWLSFSAKSAGQYMLYSIDNNDRVTAARYDASAQYVAPTAYNARVENGDFYSYVSCTERYYNEEWRATFCLKAVAGTPVKICFVKIGEPAWERTNVYTKVYPTEINGKVAPEGANGTKAVEVDYESEYFYSDPAEGGDGYYHLGTKANPGAIIFAAIDSTPSRLLFNGKFTEIHREGSALNLLGGYTADGDYNILNYVPFIMNCKNDDDIFLTDSSGNYASDPEKNCYQNFCNSDGMYPVTAELFKFLNLYVQNSKPIDDSITVEQWQNKEDWLWLSACYYYAEIVLGSKDNPKPLTLGENTLNLPLFDLLYCTLPLDGVYTLKCTEENVKLAIGNNTVLSSPFEVALESSALAPIEFTLSTANGKAATVSVTVEQTVGVGNGLGVGENTPQPFAINSLGELTLTTVTVYGLNDSVACYAYYAYKATETATLRLTLPENTTASVLFGESYVNGEASLEVAAGETVLIYITANESASLTVNLSYVD